jgi:perosamine synthetase
MVGDVDVGAIPDVACFSFYPTKSMTTGEGGMITTDDDSIARRLRLLRSHGQERKYHHTVLGLNYRLTDFQAALGLGQLDRLRVARESRRSNATRLSTLLQNVAGIRTPAVRPGTTHSYHQYTIVVDGPTAKLDRDKLAEGMHADGIETAVHYPEPIHRQPVFAAQSHSLHLPVAEALSRSVLSLPVHAALSDHDVTRVARSVVTSIEKATRPVRL